MTSLPRRGRDLLARTAADLDPAPDAEYSVAPKDVESAAAIMDLASSHRLVVRIWGSGTHQPSDTAAADIVMSTSRLTRVLSHEPDDLTVTVEAGVTLSQLEKRLEERRQTAVLPETSGTATVGGVVAAGRSPYRRLRFGPVRDRILGVVIATGDGRVVKGGGAVVKNVTGYDLPRLVTGSYGALGLIGNITLKLWPDPASSCTVSVGDPGQVLDRVHRPWAVLETPAETRVYLAGPAAQVEAESDLLGGESRPGLAWPQPPDAPHLWTIRVPPSLTPQAVRMLDSDWHFVAEHGVGVVTVAADRATPEVVADLRRWSESVGGGLAIDRSPEPTPDRWGTPPPTAGWQRRVVAAFDPIGISNPGVLPGEI